MRRLAVVLAALLLVAACGGGGGDVSPGSAAVTEVPNTGGQGTDPAKQAVGR